MVWFRLLLGLGLGLVFSLIVAAPTYATGGCAGQSIYAGGCVSGELGNGGASLIGSQTTPGAGGSGSAGGGTGTTGPAPPAGPCGPSDLVSVGGVEFCMAPPPAIGDDGGEGLAALPPVVLSDIAHFIPAPPRQRVQPEGWTVVGLPANIYAEASPHVVRGSLFGRSAEVRFVPRSFHWDYGDGEAASRSAPGASWQDLGLAEFERTPTSHVYDAPGDYAIRLVADYTAEYRYGGSGWTRIPGSLALSAGELRITVGTAQTVLVDDDCLVDPVGPGCR